MNKRLKRIVTILLAVVVTSSAGVTAFAAAEADTPIPITAAQAPGGNRDMSSDQEGAMETALIAIKSLVDIDDEVFTDFSYSSSSSGIEGAGGLVWSFYWSSEASKAYIYATVSSSGVIMQYRKFRADERTFGFAEISRSEAIAIADAFIQITKPDAYTYYKAPAEVSININNSEFNLTYYAEVNGYSFSAAQISVSINKFTGELTGYSASNLDPDRYRFEGTTRIISESEAISAYADKIGLTLEYRSNFDYESGSITVFPVYRLNTDGNRYISAVSGGVIEYVFDAGDDKAGLAGGAFSSNAMAPEAETAADSGSGSRSALSAAEISALDRVSGFITSEQALQKLLEAADIADIDVSLFSERSINLNRDYMDRERYIYDVMLYRFDEESLKENDLMFVYGRVNAETGKVYSFSLNYTRPNYGEESRFTQEQAEAAIESFLRGIAPDEFAKSVNEEISNTYRNQSFNARFTRYENDIPFTDNGIYITFDPFVGKVTSYSLNWYDNVTIPDIGSVLTELEALNVYVGQSGADVDYITTGLGNAALVYRLRSRGYIDPFTGKALDYTGLPYTDGAVTPEYGDVAGHWSERVVNRLLDNGVYLWGGGFEPNRVMTELEFLQYILLIESYYRPIEPVSYLAMRGISIEADAEKILTRQEAARIIIEYLGYGKLAEQHEWFLYPFRDAVDDEYRGYVTLCYMLGIVGGSNGLFNATSDITRAQAASILHNLILAKS